MSTVAHTFHPTAPAPESAELPTRVAELRSLPVMGTTADVVVVAEPGSTTDVDRLAERAHRRLLQLEARWTRFSPDSEVSRMNAGHTDPVGPDTRLLLDRADEGRRITGGRFDPYRLADVVNAGYERSRVAGVDDPPSPTPATGFDPGGIGKGLAADLVSAELMAAGAVGALVSIGGDLRVRGTAPEGGSWRIDVEDPRNGAVLATLRLDDGGVATSSRLKRRWTATDGTERHHLIDPDTGTSAASPVLSATTIAGEAWQAEVLSKVAFLDAFGDHAVSDDAGFALVESLHAAALVVTPELELATSTWAGFVVEQEVRS